MAKETAFGSHDDIDWDKMLGKSEQNPLFPDFDSLLKSYYDSRFGIETPCETEPCKKRKIKHVVFDADDTLWDVTGGLATYCQPPHTKTGPDEVTGQCIETKNVNGKPTRQAYKEVVKLRPHAVETLEALAKRGIRASIASQNQPGSVEAIIQALGIRDKFDVIISDWYNKASMVDQISAEVKVDPKEIMFVDDLASNLWDVATLGALSLGVGLDIADLSEVLDFIED